MRTSIILEGPNGSGKSTLAKKLSGQLELPVIHSAKPDGIHDAINRCLNQQYGSYPYIYDRSHAISRLVYQHDIIDDLERELLLSCAKHLARTHTLIYCTGHGARITEDKPHYNEALIKETTENQHKIRKLYESVMAELPHKKFNFEKHEIGCLQLN